MLLTKRIKISFVHGLAFGFELIEYKALMFPDGFDPNNEEALDKLLAGPLDGLLKNKAGMLLHLGPFKMLVI